MEKFIHDENLRLFRKRLVETADEKQRQVLRDLIAEQEEKYRRWEVKTHMGMFRSREIQ